MMNKKLLRKIKHECLIDYSPKIEVDEELYDQYLKDNYTEANLIPLSERSINDLYTRQEEITQLAYKVSVLFPIYYREEYWMYGGEYYDIMDELDNRFYENRYSIYSDY